MVNFKFNKNGVVKNKNSGVTLVALIVTIIIMLILVAITLTIALRG